MGRSRARVAVPAGIASLVLAVACAPATADPGGLFVELPQQGAAPSVEYTFFLFLSEGSVGCDELEVPLRRPPYVPPVPVAAEQTYRMGGWPNGLWLPLAPGQTPTGGRVFGAISIAGVALATFCSDVIVAGADPVTVVVSYLGTREGPPMQQPRNRFTATPLPDGRVVLLGGYGDTPSRTAERFDADGGTFSPMPPLLIPRVGHTTTALAGGGLLVAGGYAPATRDGLAMARVEIVDPVDGGSVLTGSMGAQRAWHAAARLADGRVLVAGGGSRGRTLGSAELFDPTTGAWTPTGPLAQPRGLASALVLSDGRVLVAGGMAADGGALAETELFDPDGGVFTPGPTMRIGRVDFLALPLQDGRVLIAGGGREEVELFDPAQLGFSPAGTLLRAESHPCGVQATSGTVVVVGLSRLIHRFDPGTGLWSEEGATRRDRKNCAAWLLPDGDVLIAGGSGDDALNGTTEIIAP